MYQKRQPSQFIKIAARRIYLALAVNNELNFLYTNLDNNADHGTKKKKILTAAPTKFA